MKNVFLTVLLLGATIFSVKAQDSRTSFYVNAIDYPNAYGWHFEAGQTVCINVKGSWFSNGEEFSYKGKAHKDGLSVRPSVNVMALLIEIRDGNNIYNDDFSEGKTIYYTFKHGGHVNFACNDDLWTPSHRRDNQGGVLVTMDYYANYNGYTRQYNNQTKSSFLPIARGEKLDFFQKLNRSIAKRLIGI